MNPQAKSNKLDALTGLRAIAALAVFVQHYMELMECRISNAPIGGVAVSFFFVLSGFILVYVYKDRLTSATTRKFYFTRFARIWPLHAVCLLFLAMLLPKYLPPTDLPWFRSFSHWMLLQTWYPAIYWVGCYNGVSWSISVEAFFYFAFPWLLLGTPRQFLTKYVCLFLVTIGFLFLMAFTLNGTTPMKDVPGGALDPRVIAQFFPPFRLLEFATGMAAGMVFLKRSENRSVKTGVTRTLTATGIEVLVLGLSASYFHIFTSTGLMQYLYTLPNIGPTLNFWMAFSGGMFFHAATIYVFAKSTGWVSRFMGARSMVFLGEISFAFYMIHYILIRYVKQEFWFASNFSLLYFGFLALALSLAASAWLYYLVEIPAKNTMVKWYAGNASFGDLLFELLVNPIRRLTRSWMLPAMVLAFVVPIMITRVSQRMDRKSFTAANVMQSVSPDFETVNFGEKVELLAFDVIPRRDAARFTAVWKFSSPGSALVNVHFAGTEFLSRERVINCGPEDVGQPIVMNMIVYPGKFEEADAIELSLNFEEQPVEFDSLSLQSAKNETNRYRVFSRDQLQQGLRESHLPVLTR
ncbi:acyltransferase [Mariniblastus sp.]|nr:acyltransferase [Mariniblastus sp.]